MAYWDQVHLNTGQKASLVLHGGLIALVLVFDLFQAPDSPMIPDVTEVSIISAQDFAELTQRREPVPETVPAPAPEPRTIEAPAPIAPPEPIARPEPIAPPAPLTPPQPTPQPVAVPEPPQAAVVAPIVTPDAALRAVQPDAERVAPEAAPTPAPDVAIAPIDQAAITPEANAAIEAPEARDATQREAAATETVTENTVISEDEPAQRTATAPQVSLTPRRRPAQPTPASAPEPALIPIPERETQGPSASDIENALAEALLTPAGSEATLSQADADMLRLNIEACWNVGILSTEALNVVVTIAFEMTPDARPIPETIRLVGADGGGIAAQQAAFDAGRQAIMQCGIQGYGLPQDLYDQWRVTEVTFNPARMSTR